MNYILYDGAAHQSLLPLTFTKPVANLRVGILTLREKWEKLLGSTTSTQTQDYLKAKFPLIESEDNIMIDTSVLPTETLVKKIKNLNPGQALFKNKVAIAYYTKNPQKPFDFNSYKPLEVLDDLWQINHVCDLFRLNDIAIKLDFELLTKGRCSQPIPETVHCINKTQIFLEAGAKVEIAVLNASDGPIYLAKDSEIMEGCLVRGPFALGEHSVLKMGAKIYGATSIGPYCKVGGEVNNAIFTGYSNKAHDGFIGNSVIGEWCNLGADTNNSNLKNNYANVKLWDYESEKFKDTGLQFCGLIMGDHSKCGINTMFNTGTLVGVSANIFGGNFPRNFIPSFSWGGSAGFTTYQLNKVFEVAEKVMSRRAIEFNNQDKSILKHVFEITSKYRNF